MDEIRASTAARQIITIKKISAKRGWIRKVITMALTSMIGALTQIRIDIWNACCTFITSVVILVTSPAVENLSILEKENVCIFSYMACLRFMAKPELALDAVLPDSTPNHRASMAAPIMARLIITTLPMLWSARP